MDTNNLITAVVFSAFLKCPTKAYLLMTGGTTSNTFFADIEARITAMYTAAAEERSHSAAATPLAFDQIVYGLDCETPPRYVDCRTAVYDITVAPKPKRDRAQKSSPSGTFRPVLFSPWDRLELTDNLLVCFGALALSQVTGVLADTGALIYGDGRRHRTVEVGDYVARTHQSIDAIAAICRKPEQPPLVLNKHCAVCDFQSRCRGVAIDRDDLSLLTAMTSKERAKCSSRGISTITQLSYGYRPRRRKRTRPDADSAAGRLTPIAKNDHKLRALAIKKGQIHVVGTPSLKFEGTPVFLDVEGMPDRDFYYLVGLRYECAGEPVEQSFWADGPDDEREIWESCLRAIKEIANVQIVSYGSYENRFLQKMKARYVQVPDDADLVDRLIETSVNLLNCIYGKIYFTTLSNSLKEVGPYLCFQWAWRQASGAGAPLMRRCWELGSDDGVKGDLIGYNMDDCRAAATVADALMHICTGASDVDVVSVGSLEVAFEQTWGKFNSALLEFEKINNAAYWDYQRDRIYIRSNPLLRKAARKKEKHSRRAVRVNARVDASRPYDCPTCHSRHIFMTGRHSRTLYDMRFFEGGMRRWVTLRIFDHYQCRDCGGTFVSDKRPPRRHRYSHNVLAYVIHNIIELHISQYKLAQIVQRVFAYPLRQTYIGNLMKRAVETYQTTYEEIKERLLHGNLIHADETHVSVKGKDSYVWVFTSIEDVIYVWSETRDASVATGFLEKFNGVLVSDFYSAYDSVDCPQQRCLIHLIRDLNEDIHREPFNLELKTIVHDFGVLLKDVVDTVDRFGLKSHFLRKHKPVVTRFFDTLLEREYETEIAQKVRRRLIRNRDRLFTFLDHDNVPWNNNNAEHAVKAFARLRDVIDGTTTERGVRDYLVLLSLCQTCAYRGVDFFGFLRSEETKIDGYGDNRHRSFI